MAADRDEEAELGLMYCSDLADSADSSTLLQNVRDLLSTCKCILVLRIPLSNALSVASNGDFSIFLDTEECQCDILRTLDLQYAADQCNYQA